MSGLGSCCVNVGTPECRCGDHCDSSVGCDVWSHNPYREPEEKR